MHHFTSRLPFLLNGPTNHFTFHHLIVGLGTTDNQMIFLVICANEETTTIFGKKVISFKINPEGTRGPIWLEMVPLFRSSSWLYCGMKKIAIRHFINKVNYWIIGCTQLIS